MLPSPHVVHAVPTAAASNAPALGAQAVAYDQRLMLDGAPPDRGQVDLADIAAALWRRKALLAACAVVGTGLVIAYVKQLPTVYTAETTVMIDPRAKNVVDIETILSGLPVDSATIESEIEVIRSNDLILRAIEETGLERVAEFNPALAEASAEPPVVDLRGWVGAAGEALGGWIARLRAAAGLDAAGDGGEAPAAPATATATATVTANSSTAAAGGGETPPAGAESGDPRLAVAAAVRQALAVEPIGRSRVIGIRFTARDPKLAAAVVNAVADLYLRQQLEDQTEVTAQANTWLRERLDELRATVQEKERAVEAYRQRAATIDGRDLAVIEGQLTVHSEEIIAARAERDQLAAQVAIVGQAARERDIGTLAELLNSELLQELRQRLAEMRAQRAELAHTFGPRHPAMINLQSQIADLGGQVDAMARSRLEALRRDLSIATSRVNNLERSLRELQDQASQIKSASVEMRALEREAEASRSVLQRFLTRSRETEQIGFTQPRASVVSRAQPPVKPSGPKRKLLVAGGLAASTGFGLMLVLFLEMRAGARPGPKQLERSLGVRTLTMLPRLQRGLFRKADCARYVLDTPTSPFADALWALHAEIALARERTTAGRRGNVVLFTSSFPGEGKSSLVASLGRLLAQSGRRVLAVDFDLRRPTLHAQLGVPRTVGLTSLVDGKAHSPDECIVTDEATGLDVITAGPRTLRPTEIARLLERPLLDGLRERYDLVLVDTPPTLTMPDARLLAHRMCDFAVVVAEWHRAPEQALEHVVSVLRGADVELLGFALTKVDLKKHYAYSYGDNGSYYGRAERYYHQAA